MLIKYLPEALVILEAKYEEVEGQRALNRIADPLYTVSDLAYDKKSLKIFAEVTGDIDLFKSNNFRKYTKVHKIPNRGNIVYLTDDKYRKPKEKEDIYKLRARKIIDEEVGDIYDLVTDLSKRLVMAERLLLFMVDELTQGGTTPKTKKKYGGMISDYKYMLESSGGVMDVADLEEPSALFHKLFQRTMQITNIVDKEYLNKKEVKV